VKISELKPVKPGQTIRSDAAVKVNTHGALIYFDIIY
jgi:hypothetical protein